MGWDGMGMSCTVWDGEERMGCCEDGGVVRCGDEKRENEWLAWE